MTPTLQDHGSHGSIDCPCGCEFVHIQSVTVDRGGAALVVSSATEAEVVKRPRTQRGAFVTLHCWCEDGCRFALRLMFRKGILMVDVPGWQEHMVAADETPNFSDLWRD